MCIKGAVSLTLQQAHKSCAVRVVCFVCSPCRWAIVKPWLRKYADLVCFVDRNQLAQDFFTSETLPPDFRR